jgi:hypothetical protein
MEDVGAVGVRFWESVFEGMMFAVDDVCRLGESYIAMFRMNAMYGVFLTGLQGCTSANYSLATLITCLFWLVDTCLSRRSPVRQILQ